MRILVISQSTKYQANVEAHAIDLYQGRDHKRIGEGMRYMWDKSRTNEFIQSNGYPHSLHWHILSAEYGLIRCWEKIKPYDRSFSYMIRDNDIRDHAESHNVHKITRNLINQYDLVFYLLSKDYLTALSLPIETGNNYRSFERSNNYIGECEYDETMQIFFVPPTNRDMVPEGGRFVPAGKEMSQKLGVSWMELKGEMFRRICYATTNRGYVVFSNIRNSLFAGGDDGKYIETIMDNHSSKTDQLALL